jgi:hypothetical protein
MNTRSSTTKIKKGKNPKLEEQLSKQRSMSAFSVVKTSTVALVCLRWSLQGWLGVLEV